jgi:hypothetical protein
VAELFAVDFKRLMNLFIPIDDKINHAFNLLDHIFCGLNGYVLNTYSILSRLNIQTLHSFWLIAGRGEKLSDSFTETTFYRIEEIVDKNDPKEFYNSTGLGYWFAPHITYDVRKINAEVQEYLCEADQPANNNNFVVRPRKPPYAFDDPSVNSEILKKNAYCLWAAQKSLLNPSNSKSGEFWLFREVLLRYLGNHYIIPYDFDHRKKMYPLVFDELSGLIEKRRKNK